MTLLRAEKLTKIIQQRTVVDQVDLCVASGEIVGLLGPNGAGKTTFFYLLVGLITPDSGSVFLNDAEISRWPMHLRARQGLGYLPQESSVFRSMSAEDNILAVLELQKSLSSAQRLERLEELLNEFQLRSVRKTQAQLLSGGERRRVEIARALASSPSFILLDEPFAGVDPISVADIKKLILN